MSVRNGVWHDARIDTPGAGNINTALLVIREIGSGNKKCYRYDFGIYNASVLKVGGGNMNWDGKWNKKNVIFWMPLPEMPEGYNE